MNSIVFILFFYFFFLIRKNHAKLQKKSEICKKKIKKRKYNEKRPSIELMRYAQKKSANDKDIIGYILKFLHEADFNITNIETNVVKEPIPEEILGAIMNMEDLPTNEKERIRTEKSVRHFQTDFEHTVENERGKETYILNGDNEESRGYITYFWS